MISLIKKGTTLYSIVHLKCPRCHNGNLFSDKIYNLGKMLDMPDKCTVCNQDFQIEPGFYSGALWTSFPLVVLIIGLLSVLFLFYLELSLLWYSIAITVIMLPLQPILMRWGRAIWINIFVHYDSNFGNQ